MIAAWRLHLRLEGDGEIRFRHVRALIASLVERDATAAAHHGNVKAYTVSPLGLHDQGRGWFDITTLTDSAARSLFTGVAAARTGPQLHLGPRSVRLADEPILLERTSFSELREQPPARRVHLRFASPVVFLHGRREQTSFPLPGLVTGHHRARWHAFAPEADALDLDLKRLRPQVAAFEGRSATVADSFRRNGRFIDRRLVGYLGEVTYEATTDEVPLLRAWQAVSSFARFCGTGANTTMGLGVTVPLTETAAVAATEGTA